MRVKVATTENANDGIIQLWRKWDGETEFTQLHNVQNADIKFSDTIKGWRKGYTMGWANAGYTESTNWLIDDFKVTYDNVYGV